MRNKEGRIKTTENTELHGGMKKKRGRKRVFPKSFIAHCSLLIAHCLYSSFLTPNSSFFIPFGIILQNKARNNGLIKK